MWSAPDAAIIFRERWEGTHSIGGLYNEAGRQHEAERLKEEVVGLPRDIELIGHTSWCNYEEYGSTYDQNECFWMLHCDNAAHGVSGKSWEQAQQVDDLTEWLAIVSDMREE